MSKKIWSHIAMLTATVIYGANYRIASMVMPMFITPFSFIVLRLIVAGLLFWLLHGIFIRERIDKKSLFRFFLCGFFGASLNMLLFFEGLAMTTPMNAALVMVTVPILILIVSVFMGLEQFSLMKGLGVLLGFCGVWLLLTQDSPTSLTKGGWGDVMILLNGVSYALYLVLVQPLLQRYHPITVLKWVFLFGLVCSLSVTWQSLETPSFSKLSSLHWGSIIFVIFAATSLTYLLNINALKHVQVSMVGCYVYIQPIVTTSLDTFLGYATPNISHLLAALLVFTGVYLVNNRQQQPVRYSPTPQERN